jgi:hypothetical protein
MMQEVVSAEAAEVEVEVAVVVDILEIVIMQPIEESVVTLYSHDDLDRTIPI